jgi:hypothetical protein
MRQGRAPEIVEIEPGLRPALPLGTWPGPGRPQNLDASSRLANEAPERCHGSVPIALRRLVLSTCSRRRWIHVRPTVGCSPAARPQPTTEGAPNGRVPIHARDTRRQSAEPSQLSSAVPNCVAGHTIHFGHKTLRVVALRDDDADSHPVSQRPLCDHNVPPPCHQPGGGLLWSRNRPGKRRRPRVGPATT